MNHDHVNIRPMARGIAPVYAALMVIAFVALSILVATLWMRNIELTESEQRGNKNNPFFFVDQTHPQNAK